MLRRMLLVALLAATSACAQQPTTVHTLFDGRLELAIPDSYRPYKWPDPNGEAESGDKPPTALFAKFGGMAALSRKFPGNTYDPSFVKDFLLDDMQAYLELYRVDLFPTLESGEWTETSDGWYVPRDATPRAIHERICKSFAAHWGEYGFALFDPKTGIGRCVNYAGAYVAAFTRRVGDTLVLVDTLDLVESLIFEKKSPEGFHTMPVEDRWQAFRAVANADVVEQVLLSAKVP